MKTLEDFKNDWVVDRIEYKIRNKTNTEWSIFDMYNVLVGYFAQLENLSLPFDFQITWYNNLLTDIWEVDNEYITDGKILKIKE